MQHRLQADLEGAWFKSAWRGVRTPEGYYLGGGKTVGNGDEGWAPNALFVHGDGAAGARLYINTGTKTTAAWTVYHKPLEIFGYSLGAGGSVTQATNKGTGVTLNTVCGGIVMNNAELAAAAEVKFTVTNSVVAAEDVIVVCIRATGTSGAYLVSVSAVAAGSFDITLANLSAGALSEAVVLNFFVMRGVTS